MAGCSLGMIGKTAVATRCYADGKGDEFLCFGIERTRRYCRLRKLCKPLGAVSGTPLRTAAILLSVWRTKSSQFSTDIVNSPD